VTSFLVTRGEGMVKIRDLCKSFVTKPEGKTPIGGTGYSYVTVY